MFNYEVDLPCEFEQPPPTRQLMLKPCKVLPRKLVSKPGKYACGSICLFYVDL